MGWQGKPERDYPQNPQQRWEEPPMRETEQEKARARLEARTKLHLEVETIEGDDLTVRQAKALGYVVGKLKWAYRDKEPFLFEKRL